MRVLVVKEQEQCSENASVCELLNPSQTERLLGSIGLWGETRIEIRSRHPESKTLHVDIGHVIGLRPRSRCRHCWWWHLLDDGNRLGFLLSRLSVIVAFGFGTNIFFGRSVHGPWLRRVERVTRFGIEPIFGGGRQLLRFNDLRCVSFGSRLDRVHGKRAKVFDGVETGHRLIDLNVDQLLDEHHEVGPRDVSV